MAVVREERGALRCEGRKRVGKAAAGAGVY
jgi:hypothetical protein